MRFVLAVAKVAIALAVSAPQPASSQEAIALAVEGWQHDERDGVVYYRCASQTCAAGSVVSYKPQPHRPALTFAEFENHHRGLAKHYAGTGNMRDVRIAAPKRRMIDGVRVFQISREVDWTTNRTTSARTGQVWAAQQADTDIGVMLQAPDG